MTLMMNMLNLNQKLNFAHPLPLHNQHPQRQRLLSICTYREKKRGGGGRNLLPRRQEEPLRLFLHPHLQSLFFLKKRVHLVVVEAKVNQEIKRRKIAVFQLLKE